jgi:hypothetical protein
MNILNFIKVRFDIKSPSPEIYGFSIDKKRTSSPKEWSLCSDDNAFSYSDT